LDVAVICSTSTAFNGDVFKVTDVFPLLLVLDSLEGKTSSSIFNFGSNLLQHTSQHFGESGHGNRFLQLFTDACFPQISGIYGGREAT
jgi:hypothetical protein